MFMRAVLAVYLADISFGVAIGEILSGKPHIYLTYAGYDDIAHHTGIASPESQHSLEQLDTYIGYLIKSLEDAPRPYHLIFLSDHGQSNGPNFLKTYGYDLGDLVNRSLSGNTKVGTITGHDESWSNTNKLLSQVYQQFKDPLDKSKTAQK